MRPVWEEFINGRVRKQPEELVATHAFVLTRLNDFLYTALNRRNLMTLLWNVQGWTCRGAPMALCLDSKTIGGGHFHDRGGFLEMEHPRVKESFRTMTAWVWGLIPGAYYCQ